MVAHRRRAKVLLALVLFAVLASTGHSAVRGQPPAVILLVAPPDVTVQTGETATVSIIAATGTNQLGAWTVDVPYDPSMLGTPTCQPHNGSQCDPSFNGGATVRITGSSSGGLAGDVTLAALTFTVTGAPSATAPVSPTAVEMADRTGDPLVPVPAGSGVIRVASVPDFGIVCSPDALATVPGGTPGTTCTATATGGFSGVVALSCPTAPAWVTCSFIPGSVTLPADGSESSTLNLSIAGDAPPGSSQLQIRGVSGALMRTTTLTITIAGASSFDLGCSPIAVSALPQGSGTSTCTVTSTDSFTEEVTLSCEGLPAGATCSFAPASVTPPANGTITSTLTVNLSGALVPGNYMFQVKGVAGSLTRTANLTLAVQDFDVSCAPVTVSATLGGSGTSFCSLLSLNGFDNDVTLSCTGLPAGASCSFSINPAPKLGTTTLTVNVSAAVAPGSYPFDVCGTSGALSRCKDLTLNVVEQPDFIVRCSPATVNVTQGGTSSANTCTVTSFGGFTSAVTLSCSALSADASCSFTPSTVTPPANGTVTSTFTVIAGSSHPIGTVLFQVVAVGGTPSLLRIETLTLVVAPPPDFSINCSPDTLRTVPGGTSSTTCNLASIGGFSSAVALSCEDLLPGVTCTFVPPSVTPPANGFVTSTLTVNVGPAVALGSDAFQVKGSSGPLTRTANLTLAVRDFRVSCTPVTLSATPGGSAVTSCTRESLNGFDNWVTLSCAGLPADTSCAFGANPSAPPPDGLATSTLTVNVGGATPLGSHPFTVCGTEGTAARCANVTLNVAAQPDFSVSCAPSTVSVLQGGNGSSTCTVTSIGGFNSAVALSCTGLIANASCGFSPASVTPPADGSITTTLTVSTTAATAPGSDAFQVQGASATPALVQTADLTLVVSSFAVSCSAVSASLGGSGTGTCTVQSEGGFSGAVALSCASLPAGVTCNSFNPASVTPPAGGEASSTLTVGVAANVPPGSYQFTVSGTSGGQTRTTNVPLTVAAAADLALTTTASPDPVQPGQNLAYTLTVRNNGPATAGNVQLSDTLPAGVTHVSTSMPRGLTCTGTSTVTCALGNIPSGGSVTVSIVVKPATAGTVSNTASVTASTLDPNLSNNSATATVTVRNGSPCPPRTTCGADLALTMTDSPDPVQGGQDLTYTITVQNNGPLSAAGVQVTDTLPVGVTFVSATASQGACSGTSTVTCSLGSLANGATATVTIVVRPGSASGSIANAALVTATTADQTPSNNSAMVTTTVITGSTGAINLALTMTDQPDPVLPGGVLTYTLTVRNHGPSTATNVVVTDTLPAGVMFLSASLGSRAPSCPQAAGTVTCTVGALPSGAQTTIVIAVRVPGTATGTLTNSAAVTATETDASPADNTAAVTTTIQPQPPVCRVHCPPVTAGTGGASTATRARREDR